MNVNIQLYSKRVMRDHDDDETVVVFEDYYNGLACEKQFYRQIFYRNYYKRYSKIDIIYAYAHLRVNALRRLYKNV